MLVIAVIAVSMFMWNNAKQENEAEDYAKLFLKAEKAKQQTAPVTTPGAPAAPAPTFPQ